MRLSIIALPCPSINQPVRKDSDRLHGDFACSRVRISILSAASSLSSVSCGRLTFQRRHLWAGKFRSKHFLQLSVIFRLRLPSPFPYPSSKFLSAWESPIPVFGAVRSSFQELAQLTIMGLFTRKRPVNEATNGHGHSHGPAPQVSHEGPRSRHNEKFDIDSGYYNRRPSFGQWLK
jgi:hypothetical protein